MTVAEVRDQGLEKNSCNVSQHYKNIEATMQNLYYLGALCRIIYHILMKHLVVKKLTIDCETDKY